MLALPAAPADRRWSISCAISSIGGIRTAPQPPWQNGHQHQINTPTTDSHRALAATDHILRPLRPCRIRLPTCRRVHRLDHGDIMKAPDPATRRPAIASGSRLASTAARNTDIWARAKERRITSEFVGSLPSASRLWAAREKPAASSFDQSCLQYRAAGARRGSCRSSSRHR